MSKPKVVISTLLPRQTRAPLIGLCLALLAPAAVTTPGPAAAMGETAALAPGAYRWAPELAPQGPTLVVVDLGAQLAYVYRNGVRIGLSTISSGKPGHETPTGVFTILEKAREHYSNLYDNAPMPFMQRLTWSGVALHAGTLPGHPASHGCVRLPYAFSEKLFAATRTGMTVIVTDGRQPRTELAMPGLVAAATPERSPPPSAPPAQGQGDAIARERVLWAPQRSPSGPVSLVLGTRDGFVRVMRNGIEIGHAPVTLRGPVPAGTRAYMVLDGHAAGASPLLADRPRLRWLAVSVPRRDEGTQALDAIAEDSRLAVAPEFAAAVYDLLVPGTVLVVTDEPIRADASEEVTILRGDAAPSRSPSVGSQPAGDADRRRP